MSDAGIGEFQCDTCGRPHRWTAEIADKDVACACGELAHCPLLESEAKIEYDLAAEPGPLLVQGIDPSQALPTLDYQTPGRDAPPTDEIDHLKNVDAPLWLLGGGIFIEAVAQFIGPHRGLSDALGVVAIQLVGGTSATLAAIFLASRIRAFPIGSPWHAVLKLSALSVAPAALRDLLTPAASHIPFAWLAVFALEFVLYFALLGVLFDLDESDTWYCLCLIFVINVAFYFLRLAIHL